MHHRPHLAHGCALLFLVSGAGALGGCSPSMFDCQEPARTRDVDGDLAIVGSSASFERQQAAWHGLSDAGSDGAAPVSGEQRSVYRPGNHLTAAEAHYANVEPEIEITIRMLRHPCVRVGPKYGPRWLTFDL